jgi:hypothetical protein
VKRFSISRERDRGGERGRLKGVLEVDDWWDDEAIEGGYLCTCRISGSKANSAHYHTLSLLGNCSEVPSSGPSWIILSLAFKHIFRSHHYWDSFEIKYLNFGQASHHQRLIALKWPTWVGDFFNSSNSFASCWEQERWHQVSSFIMERVCLKGDNIKKQARHSQ